MNTKKKMGLAQLRVGILVIISIGILIFAILMVSGDLPFFGDYIELKTRLSDVSGLKRGDEVRLGGVGVGKVKEVYFTGIPKNQESKAGTVEIVMQINGWARDRIRSDSEVILGSVGLLGDKVLNITPGTLQGDPVKEGDYIRGSQEADVRTLITGANDILANFTTLSKLVTDITKQIREGRGTVGKFLYDEAVYSNANKAVVEAQELMARIREGEGTVGKLINDPVLYDDVRTTVNRLTDLLNEVLSGKSTVGKLVTQDELYNRTNKILGQLENISARLDNTVAQIERGDGTVGKLIREEKLHNETLQAIASINRVVGRIDRGEGSVGSLFQDKQLYNNLNNASSEIVKLLYDFRQNPKKYLTVKVKIF